MSQDARDLITQMLEFDYTKRVTSKQALDHIWFSNASEKLIDKELMKETLMSMTKFCATQKLQQATLSMMV